MAYDDEDEKLPYSTIGTDEAKNMIEAGTRVIDVRQPDEWNRGHIAEAELIPLDGICDRIE
jgi:rhodanese-related sulfurtransferase